MKRATTSASNLARRKACPGSARLEEGLAEQDNEWSTEGTKLHALFMTGSRGDDLTIEQAETLDVADFYANEFLANFRQAIGIPEEARYFDEREVPLVYTANGETLFPGHADLIRNWPDHSARAVIDAKMGFMEVPDACDNLQLISYVLMRDQQSRAEHHGCAITQPRNFGPRLSQAIYRSADLVLAGIEIEQIIDATQQPDAPLVAGEKQCHWCRAKVSCPAYAKKFMSLAPAPPAQLAVETLSNEDLEKTHIAIGYANKIAKEVSAEMKARIRAGTLPGWKLGNSGDTTELKDVDGLYSAMQKRFAMSAVDFDDCRKMQMGNLEEWVANRAQVSKDKAKKLVKEIAAPFVTLTPKEPKITMEKNAAIDV